MKTKEGVIKAYCWIRENNHTIPDEVLDLMKDSAISVLSKLEANNGWVKIESEEDLPKEQGIKFNVFSIDTLYEYLSYSELLDIYDSEDEIHYQPIQKPLPPLY